MMSYVLAGQTLAGLSDELRIENPDYLREYHNENCSLVEHFDEDIEEGMRIHVPNATEIVKINQKIRENNESLYDFPENGKFKFDFSLWEGTYQITQSSFLNDELINTNENKFHLEFENTKNNCYNFLYSAFDFYRNNEESDGKASSLSQKCMEIIYPIRLIVNANGKLINAELSKTISEIYPKLDELKDFFIDEFSSQFIEKLKAILNDPKTVSEKFSNTLLNSFLFGSFYDVKLKEWTTSSLYQDFLPWIWDADKIRFEFQNRILPKENLVDEYLKIHQKGICSDYRKMEELYYSEFSEEEFEINNDSIHCEHEAEYIFNRENRELQRIEASFQNFINDNIEKEIFLLEKIVENN